MTDKLCYKCQKVITGPPQKTSYIHCDFPVIIFKDGRTCTDCAKFEWLEAFEKFKEFFIFSGERPVLDWQSYFLGCRVAYRGEMILAVAVSLGILSYNAVGNWEIVVGELITNLNPHSFGGKVFFVYFEDALVYAKSEYSNANYVWEIRQIKEVITKSIALAMAQTI